MSRPPLDEQTQLFFQIICGAVLVLGFATYPWNKSPWTDYAGQHTVTWLVIWAGCAGVLFASTGDTAAPVLLIAVSVVAVLGGLFFVIRSWL